jgi:ribosome-binding protein aMBF1 (putative translation factor)
LRLERATQVAASFWSNLECIYRGRRARLDTKLNHVNRKMTATERARHAQIRDAAMKDIPPKPGSGPNPSPPGIPSKIRQAREAQGLSWYALAKAAGIPNQATIRDIEQGRDVKFSNLQAVAAALGLKLELVATGEDR